MNHRTFSVLAIVIGLFILGSTAGRASAATSLLPGDLAIIGYNTSGTGTTDNFIFVPFVDLSPGTVISFNDRGWSNLTNQFGSSTEGPIQTFTAGAKIEAGTVVHVAAPTWTLTNGDEIFAFQSTSGNGNLGLGSGTNFIYGLDSGAWILAATATGSLGTTGSNLPPVLAGPNSNNLGLNGVAANAQTGTANAFYGTAALHAGTRADLLAAINNTAGNWTASTATQTLPTSPSFAFNDPRFNAEWRFTGAPGDQTSSAADYDPDFADAGNVTRGAGLIATAAANTFNSRGFESTSLADAKTNNDYIQFTVMPEKFRMMTLLMLEMDLQRSGSAPEFVDVLTSLDDFTNTIASIDLSSVLDQDDIEVYLTTVPGDFENLTSSVTFRLYGYGANPNVLGTLQVDNIEVYGFTVPMPEPAGLALVTLAALLPLRRRR